MKILHKLASLAPDGRPLLDPLPMFIGEHPTNDEDGDGSNRLCLDGRVSIEMADEEKRSAVCAPQQIVEQLEDCSFYNRMDLPGYGLVTGELDLRSGFERYLGNGDFLGKGVLYVRIY